ncbi:glycosyltransferase family 2 protein [Aquabacterium sp. A3]|uniref:glycosyltransferase family 2 protein n=1 Tax=Aquabacterium sp. A3 TaxID=3132829 RepID=UPI00311A77B5
MTARHLIRPEERRRPQPTDAELGEGSLSVVVPVYGSARILPLLHERLSTVLKSMNCPYEIIFVDDCGPGETWSVLKDLSARDPAVVAVQLMKNVGQSSATLCGLAHARGSTLITMDDDLQHLPETLPGLVQALNDDTDVVMGVPERPRHSWFRRLGSDAIHHLNALMLGRDSDLRFSSLRVMRREVAQALLGMSTLNPALGMLIDTVTHRIVNVQVAHADRHEGRSGYTLRKLLSMTMSNLVGQSMLPLRFLALIGGLGIVLSVVFTIVLLLRYFLGGIGVPGWTSTVLLILFLSGFNFFAFAVLGEYVLRILQQSNHTPQYTVRDLRQAQCGQQSERST